MHCKKYSTILPPELSQRYTGVKALPLLSTDTGSNPNTICGSLSTASGHSLVQGQEQLLLSITSCNPDPHPKIKSILLILRETKKKRKKKF